MKLEYVKQVILKGLNKEIFTGFTGVRHLTRQRAQRWLPAVPRMHHADECFPRLSA